MSSSPVKFKLFLQPLDRVAIGVLLVLSLLIGLLLWQGDRTVPRVRDFSWENKQIQPNDQSFILTFSRPMDRVSVEKNLKITPSLPGKISWAGRKMAYTLSTPAPYGMNYKVTLKGAKERFNNSQLQGPEIAPFESKFRTRDRAFVYLGVTGKESEKLMLVNLTKQQEPIALSPPDLAVMDFIPFPNGDKILFSARDIAAKDALPDTNLYTVTTGINSGSESNSNRPEPIGKLNLILDSKDYQNLKFDLSADGQTIVVMRASKKNQGSEFGLWIIQPPEKPKPINLKGGEFLIHPDGTSIAIAQGQGVAILPLNTEAKSEVKPLDFLPKFGRLLNFSKDGAAAAMLQFNQDYTRSLFYVTNQGEQRELFRTTGSIVTADFDARKEKLYCLLTQLITGSKQYREVPYIAEVDIKTGKQKALVSLPQQRDVHLSLSPDNLAILFDQMVADRQNRVSTGPRTNAGETIVNSNLWLLPIISGEESEKTKVQPEQLPFTGLRPRWLP